MDQISHSPSRGPGPMEIESCLDRCAHTFEVSSQSRWTYTGARCGEVDAGRRDPHGSAARKINASQPPMMPRRAQSLAPIE